MSSPSELALTTVFSPKRGLTVKPPLVSHAHEVSFGSVPFLSFTAASTSAPVSGSAVLSCISISRPILRQSCNVFPASLSVPAIRSDLSCSRKATIWASYPSATCRYWSASLDAMANPMEKKKVVNALR